MCLSGNILVIKTSFFFEKSSAQGHLEFITWITILPAVFKLGTTVPHEYFVFFSAVELSSCSEDDYDSEDSDKDFRWDVMK